MKRVFRFTVDAKEHRKRLDEFLFDKIGWVSKMHLRDLILGEICRVNDGSELPGHRLKCGDTIEIEVDLSAETSMKPEAIPIEILFEDDELAVVVKPAEMLVHPTRGVKSGTLLNALSYHFNQESFALLESAQAENQKGEPIEHTISSNPQPQIIRPGLVHRLDKKTSGIMVIAKTPHAHRILADHFIRKLVDKKYLAIVDGIVEKDSGTINAPIGYDEEVKQWCVMENGKDAETRYQVLERRLDTTLLELEPVTGRTNQLRIHCAFIGHPIVGDEGRGGREFSRLCLHAYKLGFWHPNGSGRLKFENDLREFR